MDHHGLERAEQAIMIATQHRNLPILIIEDNHDDYDAIVRLFKKLNIENPVYRIVMGIDYSDYLNRRMSHQKRQGEPLPALILLDLHLPAIDGLAILRDLKRSSAFHNIPVIVFSGSDSPEQVRACYDAGANAYMVKHVEHDRFSAAVEALLTYWLKHVELPDYSDAKPPIDANLG